MLQPIFPYSILKNIRIGTVSYISLYSQCSEYTTWCCYQDVMYVLIVSNWFNFTRSRLWDTNFCVNKLWGNIGSSVRWVMKGVREGKEQTKGAFPIHFPQWATRAQSYQEVWEPVQDQWLRILLLEGQGSWGIYTPIPILHWLKTAGGREGINFLACLVHGQIGLWWPVNIRWKRNEILTSTSHICPLK